MRYTILVILLSIVLFSCNKDNVVGSSPGLVFNSVSSTTVPLGSYFQFTLSFTDTNGDLDSLFVQTVSKSCIPFTDSSALPYFPSNKKLSGSLQVTYGNGTTSIPIYDSCDYDINDTCYFRFVVKDASGKLSDAVQSPQMVLLKQ